MIDQRLMMDYETDTQLNTNAGSRVRRNTEKEIIAKVGRGDTG